MLKFESFAPKVENPESEAQTSSLEKRRRVIEKLTTKFPQLRSLVLAFVTTTAAFSAPELAQINEPVQRTKIEQKASRPEETAEMALEKISDQKFKDAVQELKKEMSLISANIPTNSLYSEVWESMSVNDGNTFNENRIGNLPESAQGVFINLKRVSGYCSQNIYDSNNRTANMMDGAKYVFYIVPVEAGTITKGEKIQVQGVGRTKSEAIQNALENGVRFLGVEVETSSEKTLENGGDESLTKDTLTSVIKSGSRCCVEKYKVVNYEQTTDVNPEHRVTIEIVSGQFIPEK